jgi:hypothetical protein
MQGLLAAIAAIAVLALLRGLNDAPPVAQESASAVGSNFLVYRSAVETYYTTAPGAGPIIAGSALSMPPGYRQVRAWQNLRPAGGVVFVYGPANGSVLAALVDEHGARLGAVGLVQGSRLVSPIYGDLGVSVPTTIASGSLAAAIQPN